MIAEERITEQGTVFDARLVRDFIAVALAHDAAADAVHDLLFEHVVHGRYHPSVVTESLRPIVDDVLSAATAEDWAVVSEELINEAREALGVDKAQVRRAAMATPRRS